MTDTTITVHPIGSDATVSNISGSDTVTNGTSAQYDVTTYGPLSVAASGGKVSVSAGSTGAYAGGEHLTSGQDADYTLTTTGIAIRTASWSGSGGSGPPPQPPVKH